MRFVKRRRCARARGALDVATPFGLSLPGARVRYPLASLDRECAGRISLASLPHGVHCYPLLSSATSCAGRYPVARAAG